MSCFRILGWIYALKLNVFLFYYFRLALGGFFFTLLVSRSMTKCVYIVFLPPFNPKTQLYLALTPLFQPHSREIPRYLLSFTSESPGRYVIVGIYAIRVGPLGLNIRCTLSCELNVFCYPFLRNPTKGSPSWSLIRLFATETKFDQQAPKSCVGISETNRGFGSAEQVNDERNLHVPPHRQGRLAFWRGLPFRF